MPCYFSHMMNKQVLLNAFHVYMKEQLLKAF